LHLFFFLIAKDGAAQFITQRFNIEPESANDVYRVMLEP
jgi:hypothetical protein